MERALQLTIAGYGSVGTYVGSLFEKLSIIDVRIYDPPLGLGTVNDLEDTDFVVICVPTPSLPSGACDTSRVEGVVRLANPRRAIVCHSTVAIGTTERLIAETGKPLVLMPEYAGESVDHPLRDPANRKFLIYGGYDPAATEVRDLYDLAYRQQIGHFVVEPTVAEVVKYMENAFLATKVTFVNEFFDLCRALDISFDSVRELWLQDDRIGESLTLVTEERGYAGQCLPKDMAAVIEGGNESGSPMQLLRAVQAANTQHRLQSSREVVDGLV